MAGTRHYYELPEPFEYKEELRYLSSATPDEREAWVKKFDRSQGELDGIIHRHRMNYFYEYFITCLAGASNLLWIPFGKDVVPSGIEGTLQLFFKDYKMSSEVAQALGWSLAPLSCLFYIRSLRPAARAALSTLEDSIPYSERAQNFLSDIRSSPLTALRDVINFLAINTTIYASAHSVVISSLRLSQDLLKIEEGSAIWWGIVAIMNYLGFKFYKDFIRDLFQNGVDFIFDPKRSWACGNFCHDKARLGQLFLAVTSSAALRTVQNMGCIELSNTEFHVKDKIGFTINEGLVGATTAWVYTSIMYPILHERYYGAAKKTLELMGQNQISHNRQALQIEYDTQRSITKRNLKISDLIKEDPVGVIPPMLTLATIFGFYTYQIISQADINEPMKSIFTWSLPVVISTLGAGAVLIGEQSRIVDNKLLREMRQESSQQSCLVTVVAVPLATTDTLVSGAMSAYFVPSIVGNAPGALAAGLSGVLYASIAGLCFGMNKMVAAVKSMCGSRPSQAGMYSRTLSPRVVDPQEEVALHNLITP